MQWLMERLFNFYSFKYDGLNDENGTPEFAYMDVLNGTSPLDYLVKSGNLLLISPEV